VESWPFVLTEIRIRDQLCQEYRSGRPVPDVLLWDNALLKSWISVVSVLLTHFLVFDLL
jgi:hypothetical protein